MEIQRICCVCKKDIVSSPVYCDKCFRDLQDSYGVICDRYSRLQQTHKRTLQELENLSIDYTAVSKELETVKREVKVL